MKEIKYITVLDFIKGEVYQYKISADSKNPEYIEGDMYNSKYFNDWNPDQEACEDYLTGKGHDLSNCQWMVHDKPRVVKRYTIL